MVRLPAPVAALAAGLALAGCGGEEEGDAQFREGYNRVITQVAEVSSDIGRSGTGDQSNREIAADFERFADTWATTRAKLSELSPPEEARDEFDQLLSALEQGVDDLRGAARAAAEANPERFAEARESLARSGRRINQAEEALKDAVGG